MAVGREGSLKAAARQGQRDTKAHGCVRCEVCAFDFEATYGERGHDFCEVHHRNPLSVAGPSKTKLSDLAVLCSNCHRMIHRRRQWLTVELLAALVGSP